ncbi:hypothetical protein BD311DRAFT_114283 [Dichomitus squalens]|uniref:Uncharacterized protein n=1 Tax=Dichomitus squalens TaxID=114155 RepID=A0A4Q9MAB8_9APHY|nr:hypothetical protein BD311DRAFT_114283 [Dichomitus squalens]
MGVSAPQTLPPAYLGTLRLPKPTGLSIYSPRLPVYSHLSGQETNTPLSGASAPRSHTPFAARTSTSRDLPREAGVSRTDNAPRGTSCGEPKRAQRSPGLRNASVNQALRPGRRTPRVSRGLWTRQALCGCSATPQSESTRREVCTILLCREGGTSRRIKEGSNGRRVDLARSVRSQPVDDCPGNMPVQCARPARPPDVSQE